MATQTLTKENSQKKISLPYNFDPYYWQIPSYTMIRMGYKRGIWVDHRRCGKDARSINMAIEEMWCEPGLIYFVYPTLKQGRRILWEGYTNEGKTFFDSYLPKGLIYGKPNNTDMKFQTYTKGNRGLSMFQIIGTENQRYEAMRGTNPRIVFFIEFSRQHPGAWDVVRPILMANGGIAIFQSTPNGQNHFYDLWNNVQGNRNWFKCRHTIDETYDHEGFRLVTHAQVQEEIENGMPEDFAQQEFWCSFTQGIEGTYVGKQMQELEDNDQIEYLPYDPSYLVDTYWDIGIRKDSMAVWFVQQIGQEVRFIDFEEATAKTFTYWARILQEKGYLYRKHWAPFDIKNREMIGKEEAAKSRLAHAKDVGIIFQIAPAASFENGVLTLRGLLGLCRFDEKHCKKGIRHLKLWGKVWDQREQRYLDRERDDEHTHAGSAARVAAICIRQAQGYDVTRGREEYRFKNVFRRRRDDGGTAMSV